MLKLISLPPAFGEPSISPFCVKAMCLLRMSGRDWQPEWTSNPRKAPKGKLPVLIDGDETVPDSHFIRLHLERRYGIDFDEGLSPEQRSQALALTRMIEEHLRWAGVHDRWVDDANWQVLRETLFGGMPKLMRTVVPTLVRKSVLKQLNAAGMGRHSTSEIATLAREDLAAVSVLLGDTPFLFGEVPTSADAAIAPMINALRGMPVPTEASKAANDDSRLAAYGQRCRTAFYPQMGPDS